jgi:DNA-binding NtrC family response regulator
MRLTLDEHLRKAAQEYLAEVLEECGGRVVEAAKIAGRNRTALYQILRGENIRGVPKGRYGNCGNAAWQELRH